MKLRAGTSGFSYREWKGPFYPERLAAHGMLRFYAERLPAVEINNTFYRLPKTGVLESWARQVPEEFRFAIKASRRITHVKRLKQAGDETRYLLQTTRALGKRLGAILFQLPPNLRVDLDRLDAFLELLTPGTRAAFEFRHPSWRDPEVHARLRARDCALCLADVEGEVEPELIHTARWGYLRLRRPDYARAALAAWAERVHVQPWDEAFVFFKHESQAAAPRMARSFLNLIERPEERGRMMRRRMASRKEESA